MGSRPPFRLFLRSRPRIYWVATALGVVAVVVLVAFGRWLWALVWFVLVFVALSQAFYLGRRPARDVRVVGPTPGVSDELAKLASLRDSAALTDDEFQAQKRKLLD